MIQRQRPSRRVNILPQFIFLCLTFITALGGTYLALQLFADDVEPNQAPQIITVELIITATPLPTKLATSVPAGVQRPQVNLPADIAAETGDDTLATIDPFAIDAQDAGISTPSAEIVTVPLAPENCLYHILISGDTPYGVAQRYGAEFAEILAVNDLTVESSVYLQVGDRLKVPLVAGGCDSGAGSAEAQQNINPDQSPAPAATSTPVSAQFELIEVEGLGDITAESIHLRNNDGSTLNISNWTLSDGDGNSFTFYETLLFPDSDVVIYTRSGASTAGALFWGREQSVWQAGEEMTLTDEQGRILQTLQIPAADESQ